MTRSEEAAGTPCPPPLSNAPETISDPHGLPLHVQVTGTSGDPLVLLHGFGACSYTWRYWAPELARSHRVHIVEWQRFDPGTEPPGYHTPEGQAELVHALIRRLDLRGVTLIGHSLGGGVALLAALKLLDAAEGRLRALVLVGGAAYAQQIPPFISLARVPLLGDVALRILPARWIVRVILRVILHDATSVTREQIDAYAQVLRSRAGRYGLVRLARAILPRDLEALTRRYGEIDVPTLLVWGESDPVVPVGIGERLERDLPDAELVVMERVGHMPPEERQDESLAHVARFLARVESGTRGSSSRGSMDAGPGRRAGGARESGTTSDAATSGNARPSE
jgi:pimeloyl-ACP methyl ester carboxylesterase